MAASISHVHTHMSTGVYTDAPLVCIHILHTYDMYIRCFGSTFQLKYVCVYTHIYIYICVLARNQMFPSGLLSFALLDALPEVRKHNFWIWALG